MDRASQIVITFLGNATWQIPLLVLVTACCDRFGRRFLRAHSRYHLWIVALVLSVSLPLLSLPIPRREPGQLYFSTIGSAEAFRGAQHTLPALAAWFAGFFAERPQPLLMSGWFTRLIALFYLFVLAYRLGLVCIGCRKTRLLEQGAPIANVPDIFAASLQRMRQELGVSYEPRLSISRQHGPMTCGFRNPIIILPEALAAETSPNVINSVLAHELAHVRRHDFLSNFVHELVFLPISFHPAAWFLKQRLQQMRELRCDEMVAGPILEPRCYAQSLLSVVERLSVSRMRSCGLGFGDTKRLEERFRTILSCKPRVELSRAVALLALMIMAGISLAAANFPMTIVPVELVAPNAPVISIPRARETAMRYLGGQVVGEEVSRKDGVLLYSFYIQTCSGIREVYIKASSGEVDRVVPGNHAQGGMEP